MSKGSIREGRQAVLAGAAVENVPIRRSPTRGLGVIIATILALVGLNGCQRKLPEDGSSAAQLYVNRCGVCHRPFDPRSLTAPMWEVKVQAMEGNMRMAGIQLTPQDRKTILEYLARNAHREE